MEGTCFRFVPFEFSDFSRNSFVFITKISYILPHLMLQDKCLCCIVVVGWSYLWPRRRSISHLERLHATFALTGLVAVLGRTRRCSHGVSRFVLLLFVLRHVQLEKSPNTFSRAFPFPAALFPIGSLFSLRLAPQCHE